jgi:hypothetical protein
MLKKGGMGNQRHHRVLSTSTCDLEECLRPYAMCNIYILYYVYCETWCEAPMEGSASSFLKA